MLKNRNKARNLPIIKFEATILPAGMVHPPGMNRFKSAKKSGANGEPCDLDEIAAVKVALEDARMTANIW